MIAYDIIYLTNIPAFYKINLLNRIAENRKIYAIFLKDNYTERNIDFIKGDRNFDYVSLEGKNFVSRTYTLIKLLRNLQYQRLMICGWDNILYWFSAFLSPRKKNAIVVESSIFESKTDGLKGFYKKVFLTRITKSFVSGKAQEELVQKLNFKGKSVITKGVGVFQTVKQPPYYPREQVKNFIFVGRLSSEKNLDFLVRTFNELPDYNLNIVGYGPLEANLKEIASKNILFHGAIDNSLLPSYYSENDVLILPSLSEVWGLVVEEALNNGLPVIVSDKVGCASEIIIPDYNGIIFSLSEADSLTKAIKKMSDLKFYNKLRWNISQMDYEKIVQHQVNSYL
jgi:glycosyltransferase involved in cell wall biosynthesis